MVPNKNHDLILSNKEVGLLMTDQTPISHEPQEKRVSPRIQKLLSHLNDLRDQLGEGRRPGWDSVTATTAKYLGQEFW